MKVVVDDLKSTVGKILLGSLSNLNVVVDS